VGKDALNPLLNGNEQPVSAFIKRFLCSFSDFRTHDRANGLFHGDIDGFMHGGLGHLLDSALDRAAQGGSGLASLAGGNGFSGHKLGD
jgi:hypothetical protein